MLKRLLFPSALATLLCSSAAHATTYTVTNTNDTGAGSLRDAITQANANGPNTVNITATGTINVATALPRITGAMTITGPGASMLTVHRSGSATFAVFDINAAVTISGVTVSGGDAGFIGFGGGIAVETSGLLTLTDSVVSGNGSSGTTGAGIYSGGTLTVTRSTITGNTGTGAIYSVGTTTLTDSTIANNTGTAIVFPPAGRTLTIDRCTIANNTDRGGIGGVQLQGGTAVITNSTFSGNSGPQGGDFWTYSDGVTFHLVNVTSVGSHAPAMLADHAATVTLRNTILAGTGNRCAISRTTITSMGHNLATDATCTLTDPTDHPSTDPMLAALAFNGGPTQTCALAPGSPALDAGDSTGLPATDQRGLARVSFGGPDLGAFEAQAPGAPTIGEATPGDTTATVAFTAPTSGGDGTVSSYTVTCNPGSVTGSGSASPVMVTGLTNGTTYTCSVTASNAYGAGPASATVEVTPTAFVAGDDPALDASTPDASDASAPDVTTADVAPRDAIADVGADASRPGDASDGNPGRTGCGCRVAGGAEGSPRAAGALAALLGLALVRRRRARGERARAATV